MLWKISQCTNTTPRRVPPAKPSQYQRGNAMRPIASTPVVTTTLNATIPISGFGNPNADACGVAITDPHESTGLMLHAGTSEGFAGILIFPPASVTAPASPATPAISTHQALAGPTAMPAGR